MNHQINPLKFYKSQYLLPLTFARFILLLFKVDADGNFIIHTFWTKSLFLLLWFFNDYSNDIIVNLEQVIK